MGIEEGGVETFLSGENFMGKALFPLSFLYIYSNILELHNMVKFSLFILFWNKA